MIKKILKKIWYLVFKVSPYDLIGRFLPLRILPKKYLSDFYSEFFTGRRLKGFMANTVRAAINRQYYSKNEKEIRKINRELFWGAAAGKKWYDLKKELYSNQENFNSIFLRFKNPLVSQVSELFSKPFAFSKICEIGTGHGLFLNYLSKRFPNIKQFIGIDLNKEQIYENMQTYKDTSLKFIHSEITDYIITKSEEGTIFIASGVFEFFTYNELKELFNLIHNKLTMTAVALNEPINMDLNSGIISQPRGDLAFSHNYPQILKKCNYRIFRMQVEHVDPNIPFYDMVSLVATTFPNNTIKR